jgi:hypothetical protein
MRTSVAIGVIILAGGISVGSARADSTTSPGKENFHASTSAVAVPSGSEGVLLSGVITSGRKGRTLIVEAFVGSVAPGEDGAFRPRVNGVFLEPTDSFGNGNAMTVYCPGTATFGCTGGAHWWLDLDAAEAAHPGTFVNQPLNIDLLGIGTTPLGVVANLSARLEKKK